jgi:hypothetical protein
MGPAGSFRCGEAPRPSSSHRGGNGSSLGLASGKSKWGRSVFTPAQGNQGMTDPADAHRRAKYPEQSAGDAAKKRGRESFPDRARFIAFRYRAIGAITEWRGRTVPARWAGADSSALWPH